MLVGWPYDSFDCLSYILETILHFTAIHITLVNLARCISIPIQVPIYTRPGTSTYLARCLFIHCQVSVYTRPGTSPYLASIVSQSNHMWWWDHPFSSSILPEDFKTLFKTFFYNFFLLLVSFRPLQTKKGHPLWWRKKNFNRWFW